MPGASERIARHREILKVAIEVGDESSGETKADEIVLSLDFHICLEGDELHEDDIFCDLGTTGHWFHAVARIDNRYGGRRTVFVALPLSWQLT